LQLIKRIRPDSQSEEFMETLVGIYEAGTHFSELLERVEAGEQITITRLGVPVARLVPTQPASSPESRKKVVAAMREIASRSRLNGLRIKDLIGEGRK
jgi:prevent-host-death family protein